MMAVGVRVWEAFLELVMVMVIFFSSSFFFMVGVFSFFLVIGVFSSSIFLVIGEVG